MRPETPFIGWVLVIVGLLGFSFSATVVWGIFGSNWPYVRHVRSRYAWRLFPQRRGRAVGGMPFSSLFALCLGIGFAVPGAATHLLLWLVGAVALLLMVLTARRPTLLMPSWAREADRRAAAGLPPDLPPPPEGVAPRRFGWRDHLVVWAVVAVVMVVGAALHFSGAFFASMALGGAGATGYMTRTGGGGS